jgi:hypothetical protein
MRRIVNVSRLLSIRVERHFSTALTWLSAHQKISGTGSKNPEKVGFYNPAGHYRSRQDFSEDNSVAQRRDRAQRVK